MIATCLTGTTLQAAQPKQPPEWVTARPPSSTQVERSTEERGINPCNVPDPGFGGFTKWAGAGGSAYVMVPKALIEAKAKNYDVVVHFHGREAARKEWVEADPNIVVVGIDLGNGSGVYLNRYADPTELPRLLVGVEKIVAEKVGRDDVARGNLGIASWSAGYGATLQILASRWGKKNVDAVILLDGLHTSLAGDHLSTEKLTPFTDFAQQATSGEKMMFVSHSSIVPPGYASTTITSNYLVWKLGGRPAPAPGSAKSFLMGLEPIAFYQKGSFTMRGFSGNGKKDHCAHFGLLRSHVVPALSRRWQRRA
jgi:hypothetical protein